jgi:hypothetical protein
MKLTSEETELVGKWVGGTGQLRGDTTCERIQWLTSSHLRKVAVSKQWGAWEILFRDPDDGRYWEQTYPQSELHGGGPPALKCVSQEQASAKYGNAVQAGQ